MKSNVVTLLNFGMKNDSKMVIFYDKEYKFSVLHCIPLDFAMTGLAKLDQDQLSILFESGPIRTQLCLCMEQACKQTNTQSFPKDPSITNNALNKPIGYYKSTTKLNDKTQVSFSPYTRPLVCSCLIRCHVTILFRALLLALCTIPEYK